MKKYIINGQEFFSKNEIAEKCNEIKNKYDGKIVTGEDLDFMLSIFKFHIDEFKINDFKEMFVDKKYFNDKFYLAFFVKHKKDKIDIVSYNSCIKRIPFNEDEQIECIMPFGKYKGISLYDIYEKDRQYLTWLSGFKTDKFLKTKINQMLRFGFIPRSVYMEPLRKIDE